MNRKECSLLVGIVVVIALVGLCSAAAPCPFEGSGTGSVGAVDPFPAVDPAASQAPCPFEGSGTGSVGAVDPLPTIDPAASQAPCPFNDSGGAGAADPLPAVDPATIAVPCPFPRENAASGEMSADSATDGAVYPGPIDLDGDGTYEDLNGNGRVDFADIILYFRNMEWIRENQPLCCFDYNANGSIDFADLILLFREV
jgi:PKD repeat protein